MDTATVMNSIHDTRVEKSFGDPQNLVIHFEWVVSRTGSSVFG